MVKKQKSKVKADIKNNRLYITLPSTANKIELEKIYTDVRFCVADLRPGFDVVTDLSQCTIGHLNGISTLRKIMDFLVIKEMGRVIRIVGNMGIVFKQLAGIASKFQCYIPIYVTSLEEAEDELMHQTKPNGLRFQINRRQVEYSNGQEQGRGYLEDISISGCAVQHSTVNLSTDSEISITIHLYKEQNNLSSFTMDAKVIWVEDDRFAVQFLGQDHDRNAQLYQCFVNESRLAIT